MLCVGAHHESKQHDDQSWDGVERELVCVGGFRFVCFFDRVRALRVSFAHGCVEKMANTCRLDEHTALKKQVNLLPGENGLGQLERLTKPPPINRTVMEMCSISWAVQSSPQPPRCSMKILVAP